MSSVGEDGFQFSLQTKDYMPFRASVICRISGRVFHHPDSYFSEGLRSPQRHAILARMLRRRHLSPVGGDEGKPTHLHQWSIPRTPHRQDYRDSSFAGDTRRHLYLPFASSKLMQSGAKIFDAETYISTQPAQALEEARLPDSHEDQKRGRSPVAPPGQGAQARLGEAGFPRVVFP